MTDWTMFSEIQALKGKGYKKTQVSNKLGINFRTVSKYWDMSPKDFNEARDEAATRTKRPDSYRIELVRWLRNNPDMSTAQIYDWLVEKYGDTVNFAERTMRLYIKELREQESIPKHPELRQYEAVEDPPMGYQGQVDMGQIWLRDMDGRRIKVYCFAMVLSHSRHKYIRWQTAPFTTATFIEAHNGAFDFYGGRPKEIVYDQDRVLTVSENSGDIIHTEAFQSYLSVMKFQVYLCRGYDPESKGRVEAVVKYAENNFARHRTFHDIGSFNQDCLKWLEGRGNGKMHEITQKIPAEVFALEKEHLVPVAKYEAAASPDSIRYHVRKDNTVLYRSNRYCVPKGTYRPGLQVTLNISGTTATIIDADNGTIYARHTLSTGRGRLVVLTHGVRELNKTLTELLDIVRGHFNGSELLEPFIRRIAEDKPRYVRDQLSAMRRVCEHPDLSGNIAAALEYCTRNSLYSASEFRAAAEYFHELKKGPDNGSGKPMLSKAYPTISPKVRDINEYKRAVEG